MHYPALRRHQILMKVAHMVALYTVWYNFVRINSAVKMAPAMAAGLSKTLWGMDDLVRLVDDYEASDHLAA
jgi:hypothetical protein